MRGANLQSGSSLVEVLVSVLMLALGLLGVAAVQGAALRNAADSLDDVLAVMYSESMLESLRGNRADALAGAYNSSGFVCAPPAGTSRAGQDIRHWLERMQQALGASACGQVTCTGGYCQVALRWDADPVQEFFIRARL